MGEAPGGDDPRAGRRRGRGARPARRTRASPTSRRRRSRSTRPRRSSPCSAAAFPQVYAPRKEDICYATSNRQWAVKEMLAEIDLLLVLGSKNSSNSNRLVDVARASGVAGHLIDDETEIDERWLDGVRTVGISSGSLGAGAARRPALRLVPRPRRRADRAVPDGRRGRHVQAAGRAPARADPRRVAAVALDPDGRVRTPRGGGIRRPSAPDARRPLRPSRSSGALPPSASTATASVSRAIQSDVLEQVAVGGGDRERDAVGQLEPGVLAHRVDAVDQLVDATLARQLVVDGRVDRDRDARPRRRPPTRPSRPARRAPRPGRARGRRRGSDRLRAPRSRPPGARRARRRAPCRASARAREGAASPAARRRRARTRPP